jgi:hypothetical protein
MKSTFVFLLLTVLVLTLSTAGAQSLSELAEKEKERRSEIDSYRKITYEDAARYRSGTELMDDPSILADHEENGENGNGSTADTSTSDPDEPVDFQGRTESFWRETMSDARRKVKELENEANVLILKINELQDQFYKQSDGFYRETIQRELQKSYYEQDLNKENLTRAKAALQDLETEARKSGALPGWTGNR